jgi:hypothetical protein
VLRDIYYCCYLVLFLWCSLFSNQNLPSNTIISVFPKEWVRCIRMLVSCSCVSIRPLSNIFLLSTQSSFPSRANPEMANSGISGVLCYSYFLIVMQYLGNPKFS